MRTLKGALQIRGSEFPLRFAQIEMADAAPRASRREPFRAPAVSRRVAAHPPGRAAPIRYRLRPPIRAAVVL